MKKIKNKKVSKITIKKRNQTGGVMALDPKDSSINNRILPKIYIALANKYIEHQDIFSKNTLIQVKSIIERSDKKSVLKNRINTFLKNRQAISLYSEDEYGNIYFSQWAKGAPHFTPKGNNYKIEEESTSLYLSTFKIDFSEDTLTIKEKENGVIVNVHTIARILQRLGYTANHITIREQIDQIICWYDSMYQLALNGNISSLSGVSIKTNSGIISGTYVLFKNEISVKYTPVFLARTFISEDIMNSSQSFAYNNIVFEKENRTEDAIRLLHLGIMRDETEAFHDIKKIIELKEFFYSTDNLYQRIDPEDKEAIVDKKTKDDIVDSLIL